MSVAYVYNVTLSVAWIPILHEANSFKRLEENKVTQHTWKTCGESGGCRLYFLPGRPINSTMFEVYSPVNRSMRILHVTRRIQFGVLVQTEFALKISSLSHFTACHREAGNRNFVSSAKTFSSDVSSFCHVCCFIVRVSLTYNILSALRKLFTLALASCIEYFIFGIGHFHQASSLSTAYFLIFSSY